MRKLVAPLLVVPILLVAGLMGSGIDPEPASAACQSRAWLRPVEVSGPVWQQHRHYLEATFAFNGSRYVIINMRTYRSYSWSFWGNFNGRGRFGVDTTWTLANPTWRSDPWLLVYNC